ncbi:MAG: hypothetical protein IPN37_21050 [Betaproteobacteria bacterium]|nr:hypothetical protein [Betaproteobacteria bacterium]
MKVPRHRLNRGACQECTLASSGRRDWRTRVSPGPLIKLVGAPVALLVSLAVLLLGSALILRGIRVHEAARKPAETRVSGAT